MDVKFRVHYLSNPGGKKKAEKSASFKIVKYLPYRRNVTAPFLKKKMKHGCNSKSGEASALKRSVIFYVFFNAFSFSDLSLV